MKRQIDPFIAQYVGRDLIRRLEREDPGPAHAFLESVTLCGETSQEIKARYSGAMTFARLAECTLNAYYHHHMNMCDIIDTLYADSELMHGILRNTPLAKGGQAFATGSPVYITAESEAGRAYFQAKAYQEAETILCAIHAYVQDRTPEKAEAPSSGRAISARQDMQALTPMANAVAANTPDTSQTDINSYLGRVYHRLEDREGIARSADPALTNDTARKLINHAHAGYRHNMRHLTETPCYGRDYKPF